MVSLFLVVGTAVFLSAQAAESSTSFWSSIPAGAWALFGAAVTALAAWARERAQNRASPYADMAQRILILEERAEELPLLMAKLEILQNWAYDAAEWMSTIDREWAREVGEDYMPAPPLPPPLMDRRIVDQGPPPGREDRRT